VITLTGNHSTRGAAHDSSTMRSDKKGCPVVFNRNKSARKTPQERFARTNIAFRALNRVSANLKRLKTGFCGRLKLVFPVQEAAR
jgi:hypothetical protein